MKLGLGFAWKLESESAADPVLPEVLRAIERSGSLAAAAREVGFSYRHVWNLFLKWERALGKPLAAFERGRGARLTPLGAKLLELDQQARLSVAPQLDRLARELEAELARSTEPRLRVHASHDLALARLPELAQARRLALDLEFHGSLDSLDALAHAACDAAGFHVAEQLPSTEVERRLDPRAHRLIGVAVREQGLMVAKGNPKRIRDLRDLERSDLRLVNRQRGSGTRLVFDQLLAQAGVARGRAPGYPLEEFTHLAVASAVAGGIADVGFGIRAAAAELGLGFIALMNERYFLACRADRIASPELETVLALLRGKAFRELLASLPGYDDAIAGRVFQVPEGLAGPRPAKRGGATGR
jgi:putative molybdopterin biosynthesis protein